MLEVFGSVKKFLKIDQICIDNNVFRLHYKATVVLLMGFSLLVTSKQYIGDPIDCIVDKIPHKVMDTYCWVTSTFTLPSKLYGKVGRDIVQPGVGTHADGDEIKYHKYYQWVCFVLFFQAILFYIPRYLWKIWEGGRIKALVADLYCPIIDQKTKDAQKKNLIEYFSTNIRSLNFYAYRFYLCEILNFLNVIAQIYFVDVFLDGEFTTYGADVLAFTQMDPEDRVDPMSKVFPRMTKCTFHKYGPSGTIQNFDGLCVLPLNIVNEKIYVFLWFWFIILAVLSGVMVIYRSVVFMSSGFRVFLLQSRLCFVSKEKTSLLTKNCKIGDWFMLYQLAKNINPMISREIVNDICKKIEGRERV